MNDQIAVGAASLMSALILAALTSRWYLRPEPSGRHRAPSLVLLEGPAAALDRRAALCRTQGLVTLHAHTSVTQQWICMDCRNPSPDPMAAPTPVEDGLALNEEQSGEQS